MKKNISPPLTIVSRSEPSVVKQGDLYVIVVFPDAKQSRRSARVSGKVAKACGHAPSGTSKEQEISANVPRGTSGNGHLGTLKDAVNHGKNDNVPTVICGDVPSVDVPHVPIVFDDDNGMIRWGRKAISLGEKSRRFIEVLWNHGISSVVEISELESTVWGSSEDDIENHFVPMNTVKIFVKRLRKSLKSAGFPYEIEAVKKISEKFSVLQITGYALK